MTRLRSFAFSVFLLLGTPLIAIVYSPCLFFGERGAYVSARHWAKLMLGALKALCGVEMRVEGREYIPEGAAIVACNHQSMWETIALYAILPAPVMAFKRELLNNPVYSLWGKHAGIAVDRDGGPRALRDLVSQAEAHLARGKQIVLFPEGTRRPVGRLGAFQPGVAAIYKAVGASCTPAAHNSGAHWLYPGPLKVPGAITIRFLPAIAPGENRKTMLAQLEKQIGDACARLPDGDPPDPAPQSHTPARA